MAKDPATLWYWNDWQGGTVTLSRHHKGCYMDLLHAQFNTGHMPIEAIKIVLNGDFEDAWKVLKSKFTEDEKGLFYNERLEEVREKRRAFTESRRANLLGKKPHKDLHMDTHMENEIEIETKDVNVLKEQKEYTEQIISETLDYWNEFATKNGLSTVIKLTKKRTAGIFARNKEKEWDIEKIYKEINQSDFLRGSSGWKVDFDFIFCSENNYLKILEGKYRNGNNTNGIKKTDATARATFKHSEQQIKDLESFGETLRKRYSERS